MYSATNLLVIGKHGAYSECAASKRPMYATRMDVVSIHSTLVIGGYTGCAVAAVFCVVLVCLPPGPVMANGGLHFISEGMDVHCGYANIVMGTCSLLVLMCQLVAAVHMLSHVSVWAAIFQTLGWNILLGVEDTGWTIHYVGLALFLMGNLMYHYIACRDPSYGGSIYKFVNWLAWFFGGVFVVLAIASISDNNDNNATLRSFAVSFEFILMLYLSAQNVCLIHALDQFKDIKVQFEPAE